jgi:hypothetical protein
VSNFDQFVTQCRSVVMSSPGSLVNSSQVQLCRSPVSVVIVNRQVSVRTSGVGPMDMTGKPRSRYWPGGSSRASESGRRPAKPREIT